MREACDRCHNLKSRCIKPIGSAVCLRCQKLGLSCAHSPPLRLGRPKGKSHNRKRGDRASRESISRCSVEMDGGTSEKPTSHPLPRATAPDEVEDEICPPEHQGDGRQNTAGQQPQCLEKTLDGLGMEPSEPHETVLLLQEHSPFVQGGNAPGDDHHDTGWMAGIRPQSPDRLLGENIMKWQSDLGTDMLSALNTDLEHLLDVDDCSFADAFNNSPSGGQGTNERHHATHQRIAVCDATNPSSDPSALHGRKSLDELLDLQRDLSALFISAKEGSNASPGPDGEAPVSGDACTGNIEKILGATEALVNIIHSLDHSGCSSPSDDCGLYISSSSQHNWQQDSVSSESTRIDDSTVLLILSCYLRLLDIYESLMHFLRYAHRMKPPNGAAGSSSGIPVLAIGSFKLDTSTNISDGLMLHIILEMMGRLKAAIQHCAVASKCDGRDGADSSRGRPPASWYTGHPPSSIGVDEAHGCSTGPATESFLKSMLSNVHNREQRLVGDLYDLKQSVRGRGRVSTAFT